jgi:23S rRNA U2552 (ribose-2'-O)-methylase RlmE/FtsJ
MLEWLKFPNDNNNNTTKITKMFDIAGAPGQFILCADQYFREHHLEWRSCSIESNNNNSNNLQDIYGVYKNNPARYIKCDVLNESDLQRIIDQYTDWAELVTGDIGIDHTDDDFQEETHVDLQWGQMVLALNVCKLGGTMILKMFSLISDESQYLCDILTRHFEEVHVVKPKTSRILNHETYLICKNKIKISAYPLKRPHINNNNNNINNKSPNHDLLIDFHRKLLKEQLEAFHFAAAKLLAKKTVSK